MPNSPKSSVYFLSPTWDFLFMGGGSLLLFFLFSAMESPVLDKFLLTASITLLWIVNWPHFSTTLDRLYGSRENLSAYPFTALGFPMLIGFAVWAALSFESFTPQFIKIYTLWAPYHFSGQTLGLVLLYARRKDVRLNLWQRRWLSGFIYSTALVMVTKMESLSWTQDFVGVTYSSLNIPRWTFGFSVGFMALTAVGLIYTWGIGEQRILPKLPPILWAPIAAQFFWFVLGPNHSGYYLLVPFFHSLQYLPLVWFFTLKEKLKQQDLPLNRAWKWRETWAWSRRNLLGGALLFWGLPRLIGLGGIPLSVTIPVVFAAINLHHFAVDGVIWKLRKPLVLNPLLGTLNLPLLTPG